MKALIALLLPVIDLMFAIVIYPAAHLLKIIRGVGVHKMPLCKRVFMKVGVFPIRNHFYEPLFDSRSLRHPLDKDRDLPGIDWNVKEQLELLAQFDYNTELKEFGAESAADLTFHFKNGTFESGDAEFLYNLIRLKKPSRVFEIGSGNSTLVARKALLKNLEENPSRKYRHLCIEPYKMPWLEKTGVSVVRQRVEDVDKKLFSELESGDLLFIDSSHVIRPQGDVLFEYLELIPSLRSGVIVHIHDVFSPKDYLKEFLVDQVRFWNEQYLLEAFLTCNKSWKIIGALNYLHHNYYDKLRTKCPYLTPEREPGSFYIVKVS